MPNWRGFGRKLDDFFFRWENFQANVVLVLIGLVPILIVIKLITMAF